MRNHMKSLVLALTVACALCLPVVVDAKKEVVDIYELSLKENIEIPEADNDKAASRVRALQGAVYEWLSNKGLDVYTMRDGEVVTVNFPASVLFAPNDTKLTQKGKEMLTPILQFLSTPGLYKMLLVMHSDNTGSSTYTNRLTVDRVNSVFDWMEVAGSVDFVVPYALGDSEPIEGNDNNSMKNRERNRRLEVYLVPEEGMMALAKKDNLHFNILKLKK